MQSSYYAKYLQYLAAYGHLLQVHRKSNSRYLMSQRFELLECSGVRLSVENLRCVVFLQAEKIPEKHENGSANCLSASITSSGVEIEGEFLSRSFELVRTKKK